MSWPKTSIHPEGVTIDEAYVKSEIQSIFAHKNTSPDSSLDITILKTVLKEPSGVPSKLLPLVIRLMEKRPDEYDFDVYSFDNSGTCLAHSGYYRRKRIINDKSTHLINHGYKRVGKNWEMEVLDRNISRLMERQKDIKEMLGNYPLSVPMGIHSTIIDLLYGSLSI
jgi:hypothetical protein